MNRLWVAMAALLLMLPGGAAGAPIISVGSFPATVPSYIPTPPTGAFLVPIEISGAVDLESWQFDLLFDNTVVEEVDPGDGSSVVIPNQLLTEGVVHNHSTEDTVA